MKYFKLLTLIFVAMYTSCSGKTNGNENIQNDQPQVVGYQCDTIKTPNGRDVKIYFIKHASLIFDVDGCLVYIDPVTMFGDDFSSQPKADLLLVTHSHHDHLDKQAIDQLVKDDSKLYGGGDVMTQDSRFAAVMPGDTINDSIADFTVTCVPAYNTTVDHLQFHPKERNDVGFVFDIDGLRIYVAGDTEVIPEMEQLGKIDIAFLPVNQPFTMTPQQALEAATIIRPTILYPYHYGDTDLSPLYDSLKAVNYINIRDRNMQ